LDLKVDKEAGKGLSSNDYTNTEKTKLAGIEDGATQNQTDAYLLDRANHTGTQAISTITGLQTALDGKEPTITAGTSSQYYRGDKTFQTLDTSVVPDSLDKRYVSDAQLTVLGNTSGTNTGDQTSIVGITGTKTEFEAAVKATVKATLFRVIVQLEALVAPVVTVKVLTSLTPRFT